MAHIVVADDSPTVRRVLRDWLESAGHIVHEASDGEQTLRALRAAREPTVILLDFLMPGMTGDQVLQRALDQGFVPPRYVYVIVSGLTANFPPSFTDLLRRLSIQILPKPFDQHTLLSAVAFLASLLPTSDLPAPKPPAPNPAAPNPAAPKPDAPKRRFPWRH